MKVSFDIDGVLSNFETNVIRVCEALWPGRVPKDYVPHDWDWSDIFSKEDWNTVWDEIKKIPDFWLRQDHYRDSISDLRIFLRQNPYVEAFYITARMDTGNVSAEFQTKKWLARRGILTWANPATVIAVDGPEKKLQLMSDLKINFSVDDKTETVEACRTLSNHFAYLFDQPWNQSSVMPRVYSLREYTNIISHSLSWL